MSLATDFERLESLDGAGRLDPSEVDSEPTSGWDVDISEERIKHSKIMIVDDEILNVHVFRKHRSRRDTTVS